MARPPTRLDGDRNEAGLETGVALSSPFVTSHGAGFPESCVYAIVGRYLRKKKKDEQFAEFSGTFDDSFCGVERTAPAGIAEVLRDTFLPLSTLFLALAESSR